MRNDYSLVCFCFVELCRYEKYCADLIRSIAKIFIACYSRPLSSFVQSRTTHKSYNRNISNFRANKKLTLRAFPKSSTFAIDLKPFLLLARARDTLNPGISAIKILGRTRIHFDKPCCRSHATHLRDGQLGSKVSIYSILTTARSFSLTADSQSQLRLHIFCTVRFREICVVL